MFSTRLLRTAPILQLVICSTLTRAALSLGLGYNLLFLTEVYRTGPQIDRIIDAGQLPGALPVNDPTAAGQIHPIPLLNTSTLRAQGLTVGVNLTY